RVALFRDRSKSSPFATLFELKTRELSRRIARSLTLLTARFLVRTTRFDRGFVGLGSDPQRNRRRCVVNWPIARGLRRCSKNIATTAMASANQLQRGGNGGHLTRCRASSTPCR